MLVRLQDSQAASARRRSILRSPSPSRSGEEHRTRFASASTSGSAAWAGLVANGGLDTAPGSIYAKKGLKVSFKIIDDWTEGAAALATDNVDVMLTTADVWAKDYAQFQDKGVSAHAVLHGGLVARRRWRYRQAGHQQHRRPGRQDRRVRALHASHFLLWNGLKSSGLSTEQRNEIFTKAVHTKDGIEPATLFAQQKVDAAVAWDPDMSDAVAKRPGSKKIYDTRIANRLIADILVVSDRFAARNPQTVRQVRRGLARGRASSSGSSRARAHTLIGTIKDFNIPADLAKTMLEGVRLADYADNTAFFGTGLGLRLRQHLQDGAGDVPRSSPDQARLRIPKPRGPALRRGAEGQVLHGLERSAHRVQGAARRARRRSPPSAAPSTSSRIRPRWASIRAPWWTKSAASCAPTRTPSSISKATPIPRARASYNMSSPSSAPKP